MTAGASRRLIFRASGSHYAVPLEPVLEVVGRASARTDEGGRNSVEIRSTRVPCLPAPWDPTGATSVVFRTEKGIGALVVDQVCGIFRAQDCKRHPPPLSLDPEELRRLHGLLEVESLGIVAFEMNFETAIEQLDPGFQGLPELALQKRADAGAARSGPSGLVLEIPLSDAAVGLRVMDVERIIPFREPSPIAGLPEFATGLINVEGAIVPTIDLALRMNAQGAPRPTRIVVFSAAGAKWGLSAPRVSRLAALPADARTGEAHPLGEEVARAGCAPIVILDPAKLVDF